MKKRSGLYIIINKINDNFYIGKSKNLRKRKVCHLSGLRNNKHHNKHLQYAFNKYGEESFVFNVIEYIDDDELLDELEQFCLDEILNKENNYNSYNMAEKTYGVGLSKDKHPNYKRRGSLHPDSIPVVKVNSNGDIVARYDGLSEAARIENVSETCISECCSGKQKTCVGYAWFKEDYYINNKNGINIKDLFRRQRSREVVITDLEGNFIGKFDTIREASKVLNLKEKLIAECCSGRQKTHKGYRCFYSENFNFKDDDINI